MKKLLPLSLLLTAACLSASVYASHEAKLAVGASITPSNCSIEVDSVNLSLLTPNSQGSFASQIVKSNLSVKCNSYTLATVKFIDNNRAAYVEQIPTDIRTKDNFGVVNNNNKVIGMLKVSGRPALSLNGELYTNSVFYIAPNGEKSLQPIHDSTLDLLGDMAHENLKLEMAFTLQLDRTLIEATDKQSFNASITTTVVYL